MSIATVEGNRNYAAQTIRVPATFDVAGLDNLVGVSVFGATILTQRDGVTAGDLKIYFPPETQLSHDYCRRNNLYRDATLNADPSETGFFENNRRVKAIKLRGNVSAGLLMPLESVGVADSVLVSAEGTVFDTIDGVEICRKYQVKQTVQHDPQAKKIQKAFKRVTDKVFPAHLDTDNFFRNKHLLDDKREIVLTQKLHGCFPANAPVTLWDGSTQNISKIRVGDIVAGFDERNGAVVQSRVMAVTTNGTTDKWFRTPVRANVQRGQVPVLTCTSDHHVYTQRGYVRADEVRDSDTVVLARHLPVWSEEIESILTGLLLGDGSFSFTGGNHAIAWGVKESHRLSLRARMDALGDMCTGVIRERVSGYGTTMLDASTVRHPYISDFAKAWGYAPKSSKVKRVPDDLVLDDLAVAVFYLDDGSLAHSDTQADRAVFAVCDMDADEVQTVCRALADWAGVDPVAYQDNSDHWRIRLNTKCAFKMFERIARFVPPSMAYKLPEGMRDRATWQPAALSKRGVVAVAGKAMGGELVSSSDYGDYATKWDIQTETGNYFANRTLVHNSSIRVGRVHALRTKGLFERAMNKLGLITPVTEFANVYGSRKVIKDTNNPKQQHFYDYDVWTKEGHKLDGLIPDGYVVYGELVGWTRDGSPIQKNYTYDVPEGEAHLYVYRVAVVTAAGEMADLSWDGVRRFCTLRGLKHVPEIGRLAPQPGQDYEPIVNFYMDKRFTDLFNGKTVDPMVPLSDKKTVDEGICLRQEGLVPKILKAKSPIFLGHETKLLDEGVEDLESAG